MAASESERRSILQEVADGTLSPAEAAERLAALDDTEGADAPPEPGEPIRRVRIVSTGHPVRVLADVSLTAPVVEGPHTARRDGDTLVIQAELEEAKGYFLASAPWHHRADPMQRVWRWAPPLVVRMHPDLALDIDTTATSLAVKDIKGPIAMTVAAGSAKVGGFAGPINIDLSAGSVSASGVIDRGESSVRCSAGSVKLQLGRGSSVRVKGVANAGRLGLPFSPSWAGAGPGSRGPRGPFRHFEMMMNEQESVIGEGADRKSVV